MTDENKEFLNQAHEEHEGSTPSINESENSEETRNNADASTVETNEEHVNSASENGRAYGRMRSEFPDWDPYVYGKPEKPIKSDERKPRLMTAPSALQRQDGEKTPSEERERIPQLYDLSGKPVEIREFDPDDPQKNPLYGHWDFYAIVAIICALFTQTTVVALFFGIVSLGRTKKFHMKGRALAIIAIVLCVIQIGIFAYLIITGTSETEFLQMLINWSQAQLNNMN
ncbi:hypothetical protein EJ419_08050 [Alloscardovia theropitheci]|uniref:DUF4190 domain-containing protein n=1 Tax=Alloscardovia theropitheci TaxID=2496842 RepID=A0A4R0QN26_9BIFI|nr:DUF4190 domain-containing protein [Alloscardovia theropitheci]TCD53582.1 hypothetical protein EJ419_08050 [Alloscardovia theropitheci]